MSHNGRSNVASRPEFSHLRLVTSDHIETSVLDPHDHHHPEDDAEEEAQGEGANADGDTHSDRTLDGNNSAERAASSQDPEKALKGTNLQRKQKTPGEADAIPAAKDQVAAASQSRKRERAATQLSSQWKDPETREWKDNIVTFNSKDDPENPQNWPYRKKVLVTSKSRCLSCFHIAVAVSS